MLINIGLAIALAPVLGWISAAIGTTVAGWAMAWLLWRGATGLSESVRLDARLRHRLPRMAVAALIMGLAVFGIAAWTPGPDLARLLACVGGGTCLYGAMAIWIGAVNADDMKRYLRRQ